MGREESNPGSTRSNIDDARQGDFGELGKDDKAGLVDVEDGWTDQRYGLIGAGIDADVWDRIVVVEEAEPCARREVGILGVGAPEVEFITPGGKALRFLFWRRWAERGILSFL